MKKIITLTLSLLSISLSCDAQSDTLRVLFLGNSYTFFNNLPQLTADLAASSGKTLIFDSSTPGGNTLENHSMNVASLNLIRQGNWDYVVCQEQSQIPTIPYYRDNSMFPAVRRLNDSIKKYNPCANYVSYMTWGRRFGGQQCDQTMTYCSPVFMDFSHMTDSLASAYTTISNEIGAHIAPIGLAWKQVIEDTTIILHTNDNSHPSLNGSYLAACVFHSVFWNESPVGLSSPSGVSNALASYLQQAADTIVFQQTFDWNIHIDEPEANFSLAVFGDSVQFTNLSTSLAPVSYVWDFGDGSTSTLENPGHVYTASQVYNVRLVTTYCGKQDTAFRAVSVTATALEEEFKSGMFSVYPNPLTDRVFVSSDAFESQTFRIEVQDVRGRLLFVRISDDKKIQQIDLPYVPSGLYFIRVSDPESRQYVSSKLVKR